MYKDKLLALSSVPDIPSAWRNTSIEKFIRAQNMDHPIFAEPRAKVLMSACMECRYSIPIPSNFAYVIRTPGGRLTGTELAIGYAISRGVDTLILVAHNDCGMTKLSKYKSDIIKTFIDQGWDEKEAIKFVEIEQKKLSIESELETLHEEYLRLKNLFKKISIAPLFLILSEQKVYMPKWHEKYVDKKELRTANSKYSLSTRSR